MGSMHVRGARRAHLPRVRLGRRATFILWWSAVSVLAGVMGWLLFCFPESRHTVVSDDLLSLDAAMAVLSGFLVGAVQVAVLTAHQMADETLATLHGISVTLVWALTWPAWLAATPGTAIGSQTVSILLWQALPWVIIGTLSGVWLLATMPDLRSAPTEGPNGGHRKLQQPVYLAADGIAMGEHKEAICQQWPAAAPSSTSDLPKAA